MHTAPDRGGRQRGRSARRRASASATGGARISARHRRTDPAPPSSMNTTSSGASSSARRPARRAGSPSRSAPSFRTMARRGVHPNRLSCRGVSTSRWRKLRRVELAPRMMIGSDQESAGALERGGETCPHRRSRKVVCRRAEMMRSTARAPSPGTRSSISRSARLTSTGNRCTVLQRPGELRVDRRDRACRPRRRPRSRRRRSHNSAAANRPDRAGSRAASAAASAAGSALESGIGLNAE